MLQSGAFFKHIEGATASTRGQRGNIGSMKIYSRCMLG